MVGATETLVAGAASVASKKLFEAAIDRISKTVKGPAANIGIKAIAALEGYTAYLEETHERVSTFKTFAAPTQPVSLLDQFVTTEMQITDRRFIDQDELIGKLIKPGLFVVSAIAGYGKSMVMRYMALSLYENPRGRIPIFVELRHLNRIKNPNLLAYIHSSYKRISRIQIENLRQGLNCGAFALLLDGFDELNHDIREEVESQILQLAALFPNCSIVVSGRPNDRFQSWRKFTVLKIRPMKKQSVIDLIQKLDYDRGVKRRFISQIRKGVYDSHDSFLSTPLLAILMLLTYEQNASIPDKMHLFYAKAFETLFHKHDALKEQYDRSRKTGLQIDDFEKVFAVFCLKTYVLEKTEFTETELLRFLKDAIDFQRYDTDTNDLLFDIEEAVCLIMREGGSYFFVHRSFQEYFTALFLANCPQDTRDNFIEKIGSRHWDNVIPMLFDMASAQLEDTWIKDKTDKYLQEVSIKGGKGKLDAFHARFAGLGFYLVQEKIGLARVLQGDHSRYIAIMRRFYPEIDVHSEHLDFGILDQKLKENYDNIKPKLKNPSESFGMHIYNLTWDKLKGMDDVFSPLRKYAEKEHRNIEKVRSRIGKVQEQRHDFLKELFE